MVHNASMIDGRRNFLSPFHYQFMLLTAALRVIFAAPTAPTAVNLREVGGNSAEIEVDMFDTIRSDVTKSLNVSLQDQEGNSYVPDRLLEWKRDGRRSHLRLWFDQGLPTNQTFTATAVSQINGTWTEPVTTTTPVTVGQFNSWDH